MNSAALQGLAPPGSNVPTLVTTYTGKHLNFLEPDLADIDIEDIAHALAACCRYNGHTRHFYSVAQHSVLMSREAHPDIALEVLMHDAAEAYIGDIATPLKQMMPVYQTIEKIVANAIDRKFGIDTSEPITHDNIKYIDWRMMATEVRALMPSNCDWTVLEGLDEYPIEIVPWTPAEAKYEFLLTFEDYWRNR